MASSVECPARKPNCLSLISHFHSNNHITCCTLFFLVFLKNTEEQISVCNLIIHTFFLICKSGKLLQSLSLLGKIPDFKD